MTACSGSAQLGIERAQQTNDLVKSLNHRIRPGVNCRRWGCGGSRDLLGDARISVPGHECLTLRRGNERVVFDTTFPDLYQSLSLEGEQRIERLFPSRVIEEFGVACLGNPRPSGDLPFVERPDAILHTLSRLIALD